MTTRCLTPILLICAAVGVACAGETVLEPERLPVFTTLDVRPTAADLFSVAPGNTVQLSIDAWDETGALMPSAGSATYSSSDPAIATVSSSGIVTATAPGRAVITATLTLGRTTRKAFMTATVHGSHEPPVGYREIAGVYDLTAMITTFDPTWGFDLEGYRYTAVLTLWGELGTPGFGGTYADLQLTSPGGVSDTVTQAGLVTASVDSRGRVVIELLGNGNRIGLTLVVATMVARFIDGGFGCCGHIGGTFTAARRAPE